MGDVLFSAQNSSSPGMKPKPKSMGSTAHGTRSSPLLQRLTSGRPSELQNLVPDLARLPFRSASALVATCATRARSRTAAPNQLRVVSPISSEKRPRIPHRRAPSHGRNSIVLLALRSCLAAARLTSTATARRWATVPRAPAPATASTLAPVHL